MSPQEYRHLYETCSLTKSPKAINELHLVCKVATANQTLYEAVARIALIPWPVIAAIHFRESNQSFSKHLHNGDSLLTRTVHIPEGRPAEGQPPFTWIESATDALSDLWYPIDWDIAGCLEFMERYNGLGYQKRGIFSPYLWNYTDKYISGLFVADGHFDPEKIERRPGCVAILKTLEMQGVSLDFTSLGAGDTSFH